MYLFFDTETTGLPLRWSAPLEDFDNWPRMVQIAWIYFDEKGKEIAAKDYIIKPNNFSIPVEAAKLHGITTKIAQTKGIDLVLVLKEFKKIINDSCFLVGHNLGFDEKIVSTEFLRCGLENNLKNKNKICTMQASTEFCGIANQYGYKWPKLSELHYKLFETDFCEAHNARADIEATAKCFWEMKKRGIIHFS
ncbi:MAG: 3'-5' exonuclease [Candidatus Paceibacterota bacterium]